VVPQLAEQKFFLGALVGQGAGAGRGQRTCAAAVLAGGHAGRRNLLGIAVRTLRPAGLEHGAAVPFAEFPRAPGYEFIRRGLDASHGQSVLPRIQRLGDGARELLEIAAEWGEALGIADVQPQKAMEAPRGSQRDQFSPRNAGKIRRIALPGLDTVADILKPRAARIDHAVYADVNAAYPWRYSRDAVQEGRNRRFIRQHPGLRRRIHRYAFAPGRRQDATRGAPSYSR
jgi:hypothetical protein